MIKVKLKRFIAMTMAFCLTILPSNAFATEIDLENSSENVNKHGTVTKDSGSDTFDDETTNVWQNGEISEDVRVNVDVASSFTITIPKEIVLNGNDGSATYKVKCEGDIAGDQVICVVPDASFTLNEDGGKQVNVTVTQPDTDFTYVELNDTKEYDGSLSAPDISAGNWSGSFYFNIEFKDNSSSTLPAKAAFNDMSWVDISTVSEAGKAPEYFSVGDEKELQIGSETYHVQILGFNHDDKSDGSGKAGITVGLKEHMLTENITLTSNNISNWEQSILRTYMNNDIYNSLPQNIQNIIIPVNKSTSKGDGSNNIIITSDKLFLLSEIEIFGSTIYSTNGEGSQYQYFTDGGSKIKYKTNYIESYWERSPFANSTGSLCYVTKEGNASYIYINTTFSNSIVFGFCI